MRIANGIRIYFYGKLNSKCVFMCLFVEENDSIFAINRHTLSHNQFVCIVIRNQSWFRLLPAKDKRPEPLSSIDKVVRPSRSTATNPQRSHSQRTIRHICVALKSILLRPNILHPSSFCGIHYYSV